MARLEANGKLNAESQPEATGKLEAEGRSETERGSFGIVERAEIKADRKAATVRPKGQARAGGDTCYAVLTNCSGRVRPTATDRS